MLWLAYAWFCKIAFVNELGMRMCACMSTPKDINNW